MLHISLQCSAHACPLACGFNKKGCRKLQQCVATTVLMSSPPVSSPGGPAAAPALAPASAVQPSASGAPAPAPVPVSAAAVPLPFQALSLPTVASSPSHNFPMDGLPLSFYRELIDANGGEAAFENLTTSNVKRSIIVPKTQNTKLSLSAQMRLAARHPDKNRQAISHVALRRTALRFNGCKIISLCSNSSSSPHFQAARGLRCN